MSRSTNQTILLLSVVSGAYILLVEAGLDKHPEVGETLIVADKLAKKAVHTYKETGNGRKNFKWIVDQHRTWKEMINEPAINWPNVVLTNMAMTIMEDLTSIIKDKKMLELLNPLYGCALTLANQIYAESLEDDIKYIEMMKDVLGKMYKIIEFPVTI